MAYHHDRSSIREAYEEQFSALDSREVTVHRVVNIVEKRGSAPWQGSEYERGYDDNQQHNDRSNYSSTRGYYREDHFPPYDSRYFDENPNYGSFHRNSSPQRNDGSYSQKYYDQNDLRHHLSSRNRNRGHHPRQRGRGLGPPRENREDYRTSKSFVITRDRSPSKEAQAQPPPRSRSTSSNRSFSPEREKNFSYQQQQQKQKTNVEKIQTPSSSAEGSPHSSLSSKEKTSASAAESAEPEEAAAASVEPTLTPEEDLKARRWEAINAKVLEIEKHYSQDCETFRTVVKMLVDKEPSLESVLQAPLDKNLFELRQRCLVALKSFVTELDEILELPHNSE
ncbi:periphilin-1 [Nematolebias whitei]|uniref:periphilin-1 n=1 Tax=Nematolebias whitei TaxID=451745 RepID=UPI00189A6143|nr:periphilin-1 [Nematolebias whitei]